MTPVTRLVFQQEKLEGKQQYDINFNVTKGSNTSNKKKATTKQAEEEVAAEYGEDDLYNA